jgi:hypothetical protein
MHEGETCLQHEESRKRKRKRDDEDEDKNLEWIQKNTKICDK